MSSCNITDNRWFCDNVKIKMGDGGPGSGGNQVPDFTIYHDAPGGSSNINYITATKFASSDPNDPNPRPIYIQATETRIEGVDDIMATFIQASNYVGGNSAVNLYADNNIRFTTTTAGATVNGSLTINTIVNAGTDTDKFLVSGASGTVKFRTGAEVRSDIGAGTGNGTVTSVGFSHGGNAFTTGGAPVTSNGTISITMAGSSSQYVNGAGNLTSFPSIPAAANNATITIAGADGIRINNGASGNFTTDQSVAETITVTMDYSGADNFILGSAVATGTAIQTTDKIIYSDVNDNDIYYGNVSDLPFDNSGGTMSSWNLTGDSGGSAQIDQGDTVDIAGGTNITTTRSSNTVTITNDVVNNNQLVNGALYTTNTGTVTGTGVSTRLAFWSGTSSLSSDAGLTYNNATDALSVSGAVTWSGGGSTESNSAYDNMITGFSDGGSSTITLTLTQQDGGTLTTSFGNPQGTVTEVGISHTGNAFAVSGTPINSSGTLAIDMQGTSSQYINGAGNLITFPNIPSSANNPTITLTAGTGLTGGGTFTLNQSGASTITFNASNNGTVTQVATGSGLTGGTITSTGTLSVDYSSAGLIADCPAGTGSISENDFIMIGKDDSGSGETRTYEVQELSSFFGSGSVTSVSAANPTTGGAASNPLFISGSSTVNPTVNLNQNLITNLSNLVEVESTTGNGGGVITGTWNANTILEKTGSTAGVYQGEVVYFGSGSVAKGKLYVLKAGDWVAADADDVTKSQGLIAIAIATGTATAVGMLTRGMYTLSYDPAFDDGDILYLSTTEGQMYYEPPSGSQRVVRILATALSASSGEIFFHPDNTFIELS